jgi:hypothetical protein
MDKIGISFILCSMLAIAMLSFVDYSASYGSNYSDNQNLSIFTSDIPQVLGGTDYGTVIKSGPYGNPNSTKKIAFVVGVHPLENESHMAMVQSIVNLNKSTNYSYYVYSINVTKNRDSYNEGRMNGQLLAYKFAVPDIIQNHYNLVVDVHSNKDDKYQKQFFVCVPKEDNKSLYFTHKLIPEIPGLVYYMPPGDDGPKSPAYVTIPIIDSGTPAVVYETNRIDPYEITLKHAADFINAVEKLQFDDLK